MNRPCLGCGALIPSGSYCNRCGQGGFPNSPGRLSGRRAQVLRREVLRAFKNDDPNGNGSPSDAVDVLSFSGGVDYGTQNSVEAPGEKWRGLGSPANASTSVSASTTTSGRRDAISGCRAAPTWRLTKKASQSRRAGASNRIGRAIASSPVRCSVRA